MYIACICAYCLNPLMQSRQVSRLVTCLEAIEELCRNTLNLLARDLLINRCLAPLNLDLFQAHCFIHLIVTLLVDKFWHSLV